MKNKKPFYLRWWFIVVAIIVVFSIAGSCEPKDTIKITEPSNTTSATTVSTTTVETTIEATTLAITSETTTETTKELIITNTESVDLEIWDNLKIRLYAVSARADDRDAIIDEQFIDKTAKFYFKNGNYLRIDLDQEGAIYWNFSFLYSNDFSSARRQIFYLKALDVSNENIDLAMRLLSNDKNNDFYSVETDFGKISLDTSLSNSKAFNLFNDISSR